MLKIHDSDLQTANKLRSIIAAWEQSGLDKGGAHPYMFPLPLPVLRMALRRVEYLEALLNINSNNLPWE